MNKLLLVIDFINEIVHPKGITATCADYVEKYDVLKSVNSAIAVAREKQLLVAHVKVGFDPQYTQLPKNSPLFSAIKNMGAFKLGEWGTEFHEVIDVQPSDPVIIKHRVSALYATALPTILSAHQIDTVIIAGVSTEMAVSTITRELHDRDYQVIILEDACAGATKEAHDAAMMSLKRMATVIRTADLQETIK